MKLERFKEKDNKKVGIIVFTITCVLLVSGAVLYRTFAIFEVKTSQNVIKGTVQDPGDIYFAFYIDNVASKTMPNQNEDYVIDYTKSSCGYLGEKDTNISFEYKKQDNVVLVEGIEKARTKCTIYFKKTEKLIDKIKSLPTVESGAGLYKVTHQNANISYTKDLAKQEILKKEELRYAGKDPNNYVILNEEIWRIIGLVNTPEDQRVKLVKSESIGNYSWDSSDTNVNDGAGVNEWSDADLMFELNYMYLNNGMGYCKKFSRNVTGFCDFSKNGLKNKTDLIDTVTWNIGTSNAKKSVPEFSIEEMYDMERSDITGKNCENSNNMCNDNIQHTTVWKGMLGLMYPTDIVYASSGNSNQNRENCLSLEALKNDTNCTSTNYLIPDFSKIPSEWLITPYTYGNTQSCNVMAMYYQIENDIARLSSGGVHANLNVRPSLYLKTNVLIRDGDGSKESPYQLSV